MTTTSHEETDLLAWHDIKCMPLLLKIAVYSWYTLQNTAHLKQSFKRAIHFLPYYLLTQYSSPELLDPENTVDSQSLQGKNQSPTLTPKPEPRPRQP